METRGGKKRDHDSISDAPSHGSATTPPNSGTSLKPLILQEAYVKSEYKLSVTNRTKFPIHTSCEVGKAWDWEKLKPQQTYVFPTNVPKPLLAASYSAAKGHEYHEAVETVDATCTYELIQTSSKGAFKIVLHGTDDGVADMATADAADLVEEAAESQKQEEQQQQQEQEQQAQLLAAPAGEQQAPSVAVSPDDSDMAPATAPAETNGAHVVTNGSSSNGSDHGSNGVVKDHAPSTAEDDSRRKSENGDAHMNGEPRPPDEGGEDDSAMRDD